jgi:5-carboxymethyl-2-hydroxymuconate isomerase
MPNVVVEYTDNIGPEGDIGGLVRTIARTIIEAGQGVFPTAGVRVRAIELQHYAMADDQPDYAFVSLTCRVARGRSDEDKKRTFDAVFEAVKAHLKPASERRTLAISMDVEEFGDRLAYKLNPLHERFGTKPFAKVEG